MPTTSRDSRRLEQLSSTSIVARSSAMTRAPPERALPERPCASPPGPGAQDERRVLEAVGVEAGDYRVDPAPVGEGTGIEDSSTPEIEGEAQGESSAAPLLALHG